MIQLLQQHVLDGQNAPQLVVGVILVEQLVDFKADFRVFIRIEGGDARFGGAEGLAAQPLLLVLIEQHVIGHDHLGAVGDHQAGLDALFLQGRRFSEKLADVQRHPVADDVGDVIVKHAGGQLVQRKLAVLVDDGVPRVASALKADDHVGFSRQNVGDLPFALVAPVGAYDCSNHEVSSCFTGACPRRRFPYGLSIPQVFT